ncbi:nitroreductase family protein [Wukongibacter baidiensis]|uniref:nitroreductase family protein n=1 Tax=Wukongibacter baidiensis TaxID=1723361 RepID=UPI003D7FA14A
MMNYEELLLKRRSIRNFIDKAVSNEIIMKVIKESIYAPSSGNEQPWKFIIVNDKLLMKRISDEAKRNILKRIELNPNDYAKKYEKMLRDENYNIFYNAPSMVFIIGEKNLKNMKINCSLAASYFMMSAASRNLGTCWINFATDIKSSEMLSELGITDDFEIVAPIIVGYPAKIPDMPIRKEPEILKVI